MARDLFHNQVKAALVKDGWTVTHDPYSIKISEVIKVQIDLGAESTIAAQRGQDKIAVEIKSFVSDSDINEFHGALGQYLNYARALTIEDPIRTLYLAVPVDTYTEFFQVPFIQATLQDYRINLIVYEPIQEVIQQWINFNTTDN
ncbi:MAG: element excision factor XisH family protein [Cyanobacteria bacterium P01_F01_bin.150]